MVVKSLNSFAIRERSQQVRGDGNSKNGRFRGRSEIYRYFCEDYSRPQCDPLSQSLQTPRFINTSFTEAPARPETAKVRSHPNYKVTRPLSSHNMDGPRRPDNPAE